MELIAQMLSEWGPPFLGWALAAWLLWERRTFVNLLVEVISSSTAASNENARAIASLESKISRLMD